MILVAIDYPDQNPPPAMWQAGDVGVFARYPFPPSLERIRGGGF